MPQYPRPGRTPGKNRHARDANPTKGADVMSGEWVNFKELRAKLRFSDVLESYDVHLKVKGDRATGFCPLPHHPRREGKRHSPSFSANLARGIFQCFGCGAKGTCWISRH